MRVLMELLKKISLAFVAGCCRDDDNPQTTITMSTQRRSASSCLTAAFQVVTQQGVVTGEVDVGLEKETPLLQIRFLNEEGDSFTPHTEDGYSLGWEVTDSAIAEVEWHEEDGLWAFHIIGESVGETTMTIKINHGGHSDFVSLPFEIHVTEGGPGEDHDHEGE